MHRASSSTRRWKDSSLSSGSTRYACGRAGLRARSSSASRATIETTARAPGPGTRYCTASRSPSTPRPAARASARHALVDHLVGPVRRTLLGLAFDVRGAVRVGELLESLDDARQAQAQVAVATDGVPRAGLPGVAPQTPEHFGRHVMQQRGLAGMARQPPEVLLALGVLERGRHATSATGFLAMLRRTMRSSCTLAQSRGSWHAYWANSNRRSQYSSRTGTRKIRSAAERYALDIAL